MDEKIIQEIKASLIKEQNEILKTLSQKTADFSEVSEDNNLSDYTDIASWFTDQQMIENIGQKSANRLKQIKSALIRIEEGKYGRCIKCKKEIPIDRLKAIPYALKCIECQSLDEKRK